MFLCSAYHYTLLCAIKYHREVLIWICSFEAFVKIFFFRLVALWFPQKHRTWTCCLAVKSSALTIMVCLVLSTPILRSQEIEKWPTGDAYYMKPVKEHINLHTTIQAIATLIPLLLILGITFGVWIVRFQFLCRSYTSYKYSCK